MTIYTSEPLCTLWNGEHTASIKVLYQEDNLEEVSRLDADYFGVEIFSTLENVASCFSAEPETYTRHQIVLKEVEARRRGDRVFYLHYGEHSCYAFRVEKSCPKADWDSGCCGILVVRRDRWPEKYWVDSFVYRLIHKAFSEPVEACLNGWVYEAFVSSEDETVGYPGSYSVEDAVKYAQEEYPDIKYREDEFEEETTYRLAA